MKEKEKEQKPFIAVDHDITPDVIISQDSIVCLLLNKDTESTFIAILEHDIDVRVTSYPFGLPLEEINEGEAFRLLITIAPGKMHQRVTKGTPKDYIELSHPETLKNLHYFLRYQSEKEKQSWTKYIESIPTKAQELRNEFIDQIITK